MSSFESNDKFLVNNASGDATQSHCMTGTDLFNGNYGDAIVLVVKEPTASAPVGSVTTSYKCAVSDLGSKIPDASTSFNYWMLVNRGSTSYKVSAKEVLNEYSVNTGFEGLDFSQAGDSFTLADGASSFRYAFCLGREPDYSYTSPNVIWATVSTTEFAKFELQNGTFTKVGGNIKTDIIGYPSGGDLIDITDTGTHIIIIGSRGEVNRYNKSTGSLETQVKTGSQDRRGVVWKSPFFYTGFYSPSNSRDAITVYPDQSSNTTYQNIVNGTNTNTARGLAYDPEDDLFYQCFSNGSGTIFSTTNSSSNINSVSFTNEGTLPSWTDRGTIYSYDILKNSNGKFIIGKAHNSGKIWCLYKIA